MNFLKVGIWLIVGGVVLALAPIGIALLSGAVASAAGCQIDEGSVRPCLLFGSDMGGLLYAMLVTGWLALATFPIGGGVALLGLVVVVAAAIVRALRKGRSS